MQDAHRDALAALRLTWAPTSDDLWRPQATHVDGLNGTYGDRVRPLLPCARNAFTQLTSWVEHRRPPPQSRTIPRPAAGSDAVNTCALR